MNKFSHILKLYFGRAISARLVIIKTEIFASGIFARHAYALKNGEGAPIHFRGTKITVKVSKEDSNGKYTMLEMVHPPNIGSALHIHPNAPKAYYVLEGEYQI